MHLVLQVAVRIILQKGGNVMKECLITRSRKDKGFQEETSGFVNERTRKGRNVRSRHGNGADLLKGKGEKKELEQSWVQSILTHLGYTDVLGSEVE